MRLISTLILVPAATCPSPCRWWPWARTEEAYYGYRTGIGLGQSQKAYRPGGGCGGGTGVAAAGDAGLVVEPGARPAGHRLRPRRLSRQRRDYRSAHYRNPDCGDRDPAPQAWRLPEQRPLPARRMAGQYPQL